MIVPIASKHWNSVQNMPTMNHLVYDDTHLSRPPAPALSLMPWQFSAILLGEFSSRKTPRLQAKGTCRYWLRFNSQIHGLC